MSRTRKIKEKSGKDQELNRRIGARIRGLRRARGWTIERLAGEVGVSSVHLQSIETARRGVSLPKLAELCAVFQIDLARFFEFEQKNGNSDNGLRDKIRETERMMRETQALAGKVAKNIEEIDKKLGGGEGV